MFLFAQRNRAWFREPRTDTDDSAPGVDPAAPPSLWIATRGEPSVSKPQRR